MTITGADPDRPVRPARLADPALAPPPATSHATGPPEVKPDAAVARAPPRRPTGAAGPSRSSPPTRRRSGVPLDPSLAEIRSTLAGHRRRLWFRRAVRRFWAVAAVVAVAELVLAIAQRLVPLEQAPLVALAIPVVGRVVLLVLVVLARPTLGETALAVDAEGGSGDAVASALAFASAHPEAAGPASDADDGTIAVDGDFDLGEAEGRFVRRQRRDALARLRAVEPVARP